MSAAGGGRGDPRPALVHTLRRRLAYAVDLGAADAALRSIAHAAARSGARSLDAVAVDGVIRVALDVEALPARSARLDQLAGALVLRVRFVRGAEVRPPSLDPAGRGRRELLRAVRFYAARVASRWRGALDDDDPEELHALRASLRRLKAALAMIGDGHHDASLRAVSAWARALAPRTGAVRDLDVAIGSLAALAPDAGSLAASRQRLRADRARAFAAMAAHLRRAEVVAAMRAATAVAPRLDGPRGRARRVVGRALDRGLERLARALDRGLDAPEDHHRVRRRARRVRDLVEVAGGALRRRDRVWRERLQEVQSQLGATHDADVLAALLAVDDPALAGLRRAVAHRRAGLRGSLTAPLAELAAALADAG